MTRYSKEFKENIIKQMMPPANKSVNQLAAETGVSEPPIVKLPLFQLITGIDKTDWQLRIYASRFFILS